MARTPLALPNVGDDGSLYGHVGKYAGMCVMRAFEDMGGQERFSDWASKNPADFYTKLLPKVIARPVEVTVSEGVEDMLARLDEQERVQRVADLRAVDADYATVEESD